MPDPARNGPRWLGALGGGLMSSMAWRPVAHAVLPLEAWPETVLGCILLLNS